MEIYDLNDREFKIAVLKKLNNIHKSTDRQFNELWSKISKQNEYFTIDIESLKKN